MNKKIRKLTALLLAAALPLISIVGCGSSTDKNKTQSEVLQVACTSEPQSMDPHMSSSVSTRQIGRYIWEGLFEMDSDYNAKPQLCESYTTSDDHTTYTFKLREGVKFHNGEEMKAADAAASLNRWASMNSSAVKVITNGEQFTVKDDYTVEIKLDVPSILLPEVLCAPSQFAAIMPASVIEKADASNGITEYIGTGSLKFDSWVDTQYIKMVKYDDYKGPGYKISGEAGDRTMNFKEVYFNFVSDATTTLNGLESGEYNIVDVIGYDYIQQAEASDNINLYKYLQYMYALNYNKSKGVFTDINMRKAVVAALDFDEIMAASLNGQNEEYCDVNSSVMSKEQSAWFSEKGDDLFNVHDQELAKKYLKEAGYNGEEVHVISTSAYSQIENAVLVIVQQLEAVGINVKLDTYDWATFVVENKNADGYDLFVNMFPIVSTPHTLFYLSERCGFTHTEELDLYFAETNAAESVEDAQNIWKNQAQPYINEELLLSKFADSYACMGTSSNLLDVYAFQGYCFWGASFAE